MATVDFEALIADFLWICTPEDIDRGAAEFRTVPFVQSLLRAPAGRVVVTVESCD